MANFPVGKVNGSTLAPEDWNQIGGLNNAINSTTQTASAGDLTQIGKSMAEYGAGNFYTDSGAADAYVLTPIDSMQSPANYFDGMQVRFRAANPSTGSSTVNVNGMGVVDIKQTNGITDIGLNDITTSGTVLEYDSNNGVFILTNDLIQSDNKIINGNFQITQRGTSFTAVTDGDYTLDRWVYNKSGTMVHTISQDSDIPTVTEAGRYIGNSLKIDCTTADATIGAGDFASIEQKIQGYDYQSLAQKQFTVSVWVKATKTGDYCVGFGNSGQDRSYIKEFTINASNTWEEKIFTVEASPSAGTWDYTDGIGLSVKFMLACGTTYQTTADTWQTGDFFGTANQVNACDNTANDFFIAGVEIVPGSTKGVITRRMYQEELALCSQFYTSSQANSGTNLDEFYILPVGSGTQVQRQTIAFSTLMAGTPTITTNVTGGSGLVDSVEEATTRGFRLGFSGATNDYVEYTWTADAEI